MFHTIAKTLSKLLPLISITPFLLYSKANHSIKLSQSNDLPSNHPSSLFDSHAVNSYQKIKFIDNIHQYINKEAVHGKAIIFFQMTGDPFIDEQAYSIAKQFVETSLTYMSQQFQFVFLKNTAEIGQNEFFFIIFGRNGEKIINLDPYLNKDQSNNVKINYKGMFDKIIESVNTFKEINLSNLHKQLDLLDKNSELISLVVFAKDHKRKEITKAKTELEEFTKNYDINGRNVQKYVITDEQTRCILGLSSSDYQPNQVYLIVPKNNNLKSLEKIEEEAQPLINSDKKLESLRKFYSINGKQYTIIAPPMKKTPQEKQNPIESNFVFPQIFAKKEPKQKVLSVYLDRNKDKNQELLQKIYQQFSKDQLKSYKKNIFYSSEERLRIELQLYDYTQQSLKAYEVKTKLQKQKIKQLLSHPYEWKYPLESKDQDDHDGLLEKIDAKKIRNWIQSINGDDLQKQYFKSEEQPKKGASKEIVGEQYLNILSHPSDKIIYHYSEHCHGCKKFGHQYEELAEQKAHQLSYYRINNDYNKVEGIRNYDSTPVFVFYKKNVEFPFLYKMPYFTKKMFGDFLQITKEIKLIQRKIFEEGINEHRKNEVFMKDLVA